MLIDLIFKKYYEKFFLQYKTSIVCIFVVQKEHEYIHALFVLSL